MNKFKIGKKVKIIGLCNCQFYNECELLQAALIGIIINTDVEELGDSRKYRVEFKELGICRFREDQLILVENNIIKPFGIVAFTKNIIHEKI